ncbi:hypothetical protein HPB50_008233 [Hyalomma asiaticum]|uniref:Uncharacterized protein n=1 Tax=Hyalomma asiaticum TaxID=266040 RepID=A0ACB7SJ13_HYAAI|nr:hypothetical protein HPB50_008233 [Hyalomma asiaticum]
MQVPLGRLNEHLQTCRYESAVCESCDVLPVHPHDECPKRLVRCHRRRHQNKCADVLDGGHDCQQTMHGSVEQKPAKLYNQRYETAVCESCNVLPVHQHDECPKRLVHCHRRCHQNKCTDVLDGGHHYQQTIHESVEQKPAKLYEQRYEAMREVSRLSLQIRDIDTIMTMYEYETAVCESCNVLPVHQHDECPKRLVHCHRRCHQNKCTDVLDGGHHYQQTIHESVEQKPAKLYEQRYEAMREVSRLSLQIRDIDTIMTMYE